MAERPTMSALQTFAAKVGNGRNSPYADMQGRGNRACAVEAAHCLEMGEKLLLGIAGATQRHGEMEGRATLWIVVSPDAALMRLNYRSYN